MGWKLESLVARTFQPLMQNPVDLWFRRSTEHGVNLQPPSLTPTRLFANVSSFDLAVVPDFATPTSRGTSVYSCKISGQYSGSLCTCLT